MLIPTFAVPSGSQGKPSCVIPFPRNKDFVVRQGLLDQLGSGTSELGSRLALVGMGGVGYRFPRRSIRGAMFSNANNRKSQLATEHGYRTHEANPETWVFWAHAGDASRFEEDYRRIAKQIGIPNGEDPQQDVFKLVHDWMNIESKGNWLLVIDNADDDAFLRDASNLASADLKRLRYLKETSNGTILMTTRAKSVARMLVEESQIVEVGTISASEAESLLRKKLGAGCDDDGVPELAEALGNMPLALIQAAAYIRRRSPLCTVRDYLDQFQTNDHGKLDLFQHDDTELQRDARASVITTWGISFNHISRTRPSAADLLSLMSFFDRQGIPESLLQNRTVPRPTQADTPPSLTMKNRLKAKLRSFKRLHLRSRRQTTDRLIVGPDAESLVNCHGGTDSEKAASDDRRLKDDIQTLRDYSFISVTTDSGTFEMHALVQLAMRTWLEIKQETELWKEVFIHNLRMEFPDPENYYEEMEVRRSLFPHAIAARRHKPLAKSSLSSLHEWADLMRRAGWYARDSGSYAVARDLFEASHKVLTLNKNDDTWEMINCIDGLGKACDKLGDYINAERYALERVEIAKHHYGDHAASTLRGLKELAWAYCRQRRFEDAERILEEVLEFAETDSDHAVRGMGTLAAVYKETGRLEEAADLQRQVLDRHKSEFGDDDPITLIAMNNLAATYREMGQWDEAEELKRRVLVGRERRLGKEHPGTLSAAYNLGVMHLGQKRFDEAEALFVRSFDGRRKVLGESHPDTLTSTHILARCWSEQGRLADARRLGEDCFNRCKRILGEDHVDTLRSMHNLAIFCYDLERVADASSLIEDCFARRKKVLGQEHRSTLYSMHNLALYWYKLGRQAEAKSLMEDCRVLKEKVLPNDSSSRHVLQDWKREQEASETSSGGKLKEGVEEE